MTLCTHRRLMVMKKMLFTASLLFVTVLVHAQAEKETLYGFQQRIIPGAKAAGDIDETGRLIKKDASPAYHHTLYLATASTAPFQPIQIWINGVAFSAKAAPVQTPVTEINTNLSGSDGTVLIPKTAATIYKLTPTPLTTDKSSRKLRAKAKENAVVVCYKTGKKSRYAVLKKFTDLGALSLQ
jgi:hypothetical protein